MADLQEKTSHLPTAAVVIPTFKRPGLALRLARQIRRYHSKLQIVIVDQENLHPPDRETLAQLAVEYHNLKRANTSAAKNLGIKQARGEVVIFFDDDVEITKETINDHLGQYSDQKIVGVAGRVVNDGEIVPKDTSVKTGVTNCFGTQFLYRFWSTKKQTVDFVYGCNMSFRRTILNQIKGFDEAFPKIFEEVDLSRRAKKYGKIIFAAAALAYHHKAPGGGIRPEEKLNKQKLIFENYGRYLAKNVVFPLSIVSLGIRTITALKRSVPIALSLHKGYFSTLSLQLINLLKQNYLLLIAICLVGFLRFWKSAALFNFTFSEENQAHMAWEQVKNFHPIWIGVSAANINYYLGPGLTYLNYILFLLSKGDPIILAYFSSLLGLITSISVYFVTKELFNKRTALFSAIIYGCSTLINFHDRRFWNATPIPFITVWLIYSLIKSKGNTRWYIISAFLIGCIYHAHLSLLLFLLPTAYSIIVNRNKIATSTWIMMVAIYLLITSPLIVFDFVHNFDNLLMPIRTITGQQKAALYQFSIGNITDHIRDLLSTLGRLWFIAVNTNPQDQIVLESHYGKTTGNPVLSLISIAALIYFFFRNRESGYQIFFISTAAILLAFLFYPSYNPEYYLMSFLLLTAIVCGYWLNSLPKTLAVACLILFVTANLISTLTMSDKYGLLVKKRLIKKTMQVVANQSFRLETFGELPNPQFAYAGWRYLFKAYGKTPVTSNVDSVLGYLYPDELINNHPQLKIVVADTIQPAFKQKPLSVITEGVYRAYIFNNE